MPLLLVMLGGALGAGARHLVGRALPGAGTGFPWATLSVNVSGGLLMGGLVAVSAGPTDPWRLFLGVGVLGGFTTFSAFSLETVMLMERGQPGAALLYASASVIGAIAALFVGLSAVRAAT